MDFHSVAVCFLIKPIVFVPLALRIFFFVCVCGLHCKSPMVVAFSCRNGYEVVVVSWVFFASPLSRILTDWA